MKLLHTYDSSLKTLIWFHYSTGYRIRNPRRGNKLHKVFSSLSATSDSTSSTKFNNLIVDGHLTIRTKDNQ
ncbi:hypothetical protein HYP07_gp112 [Vibrio phage JSF3]|uniref:hypothetical protein n=1 Tax=Vibrio phage JSF3 TaxID=1916111 RepID=UPI000B60D6F6|nr:hypothetical protein HYP07_gp112 [Vibrio phage JSF3]APD18124.1 hypothetical protein [Vibrio phage JSF3]